MTRDELVKTLLAISQVLASRVEIWREMVDEKGRVVQRVYCGSFTTDTDRSRDTDRSHDCEHAKGEAP